MLSEKSKKIIKELQKAVGNDPWHKLQVSDDGIHHELGHTRYDLKVKEEREKYEYWLKMLIGSAVYTDACVQRKRNRAKEFSFKISGKRFKKYLTILHLLDDLGWQIETQDIIDGFDPNA